MDLTVLKKSTFLITREPQQVVTVLGSCIAVTLFCPKTHDAAICHAVLAHAGPVREGVEHLSREGRYVSEVIPRMVDHFFRLGCLPQQIEAKLFGGACISCKASPGANSPEIGVENVEAALQILLGKGLRLRAINTGGLRPHKLFFNTATGEVLHQFLKGPSPAARERHG